MSLKRDAKIGVKWTGVAAIMTAGLQFLQLAVLARLLTPEDFGLVAMIMIVIGFAQVYADMGISKAIIHRQDSTREQLSSLYWLNFLAGLLVFLLVVSATSLVVAFYQEPRLTELVPVAALVFLIIPLGQQFQVLLEKELRFKELAIIETSAAGVAAAIMIAAAMFDQGVYALIWGQLSNAGWKALWLFAIGWRDWRPSLRFRRQDLKGYLGFGLYQMGEKSINFFYQRLDQLLIGMFLGAQALGYYSLAYHLVLSPVSRINPILTRVAFPIFARVQHDTEKLKLGFMMMRKVLATFNFPILLGTAAIAPVLVPVVMGDHWLPSVIPIQILALVGMVRSMGNPVGALLLALGRADLGFYVNCLVAVVLFPAVYLGVKLGNVTGVSLALLLTVVAFFWVGYFVLVRRLLGPCLGPYLTTLGPAALTAGIMALAVAGFALVVPLEAYPLLIAQVGLGVVIYVALNWFLFRDGTVALLRLVWGKNT